MKTFKILARLFTGFGLVMMLAVSGWGDTENNDNCTQIEQISEMHNQTGSYSRTETGQVQNGDPDFYYFTIPQTGTLTYSYTSTANTDLRVQVAGTCSTTMNRVLDGGTSYSSTLAITAGQTVMMHIARRNGTPDYSLNLGFSPLLPPVIANATRNIAENSAGGVNVGTPITATNSPTSFSITGGTGQSLFDISATGQITVHAGAALDYETTSSYTLLVKASNSGGDSNIATITINITDVATENLHEGSRPFTIRNPANTRNIFGNYFVGGNTNMCVTDSTANFNGTCTANTSFQNNSYYTKYIDVDSNTSTFNSSDFTLNIPSGSKVIWAGLYWQGYIHNSDQNNDFRETMTLSGETVSGTGKGLDLSVNSFDAEKVFFQTPQDRALNVNNYQAVVAEQLDFDNLGYAGFKNVTSLVSQMSPNGIYTIANIQSHRGKETNHGNFAGWSLVVVYENSTEDLNNVSVFDGYETVDSSYNQDITVSGFYTPTSGTVNSKLTVFSMEGEGATGDSLRLNGNLLPVTGLNTDTGTTNNVFNGSITNVPIRNPILTNNDGLDLDTFNTSSIITNGQSSATIQMRTTGDRYTPSMLVFFTKLYQPEVCYYEEVYKGGIRLENGAQVNSGDALNVKVFVTNKANETAEKVKVYRTFDTLLPYTENTTHLDNNNPIYGGTYTMVNQTDNVDADTFDYNATDKKFQIRIGTGASPTSGGNLVTNQGAAFDYNITMNSEQNTSITYEVAYTNTVINFDYIGQIGKCVDFNNTFWGYSAPVVPSGADIIDTFTTEANYNNNSSKVIKTKIASQSSITITAVHLNSTNQASAYTASDADWKFSVIPFWSDETCSSQENVLNVAGGEQVVIDIPNNQVSATALIQIKDKAVKNARFKIIVVDPATLSVDGQQCIENSSTTGNFARIAQCANSEVQYKAAFGNNAWTRCGLGGGKPCEPSNHGAADVNESSYNSLYAGDLGCYICTFDLNPSCSTDNFAIRPNEFNSSLTTGQQFQAGVSSAVAFYANKFGGNGTTDYNESEIALPPSFAVDLNISDSNKTCAQPSLHFDPRIEFSNGLVSGLYKIVNVGDFNVTMHEINGSEYALVDADDTSDSLRLITPFTRQIKVVPHHFGLDGNFTNRSNGFTYLSNFEDYNTSESRAISAALDFNITAQAVDNNTTSNYTELCYAKDGNVTMTLANALVINPVGSLTRMLWYDQNHDINGSIPLGGTTYRMDMNATQFDSVDVNGTAQVRYLINFDRDEKLVVDPLTMTINQVTATDADAASGTKVLNANNTANYLYGRIIPRDVRTFGSGVFTASAWYEVYKAIDINGTSLPVSRNDANWYTNTLHTDLSDGNGDVTVVITGANPANTVAVNGMETYTFGAGYALGGYKAHINTDPWLWYGMNALGYLDPVNATNLDCLTHPCFNINVVPAVGATGSAKSTNTATKASKRSTEGGGTWKSTKDYAPAIR